MYKCFVSKKTARNEIKIFNSVVMKNSLYKKYEKEFDKSKNYNNKISNINIFRNVI